MEHNSSKHKHLRFHRLKIAKIERLTKTVFALELHIPEDLETEYHFEAGQYVTFRYEHQGQVYFNDYSMTSASYEKKLTFGIKINTAESSVNAVINKKIGDTLEVSEPQGRFTLVSKPHEFRTILGFASGIGITPVLSHFKTILHSEPRTRLFLFYGNKTSQDIAFRNELDELARKYGERLQIFYFLSQERTGDSLLFGRLNENKLKLIINQILHLDDTDEESTIWDSVDEVLICGKGEMIKTIANSCYENGIPKRNIHFELFEEFNDDIYPVEKEFPLVENIEVEFKLFGERYSTVFKNNKNRILQELLLQKFPVAYSCKSGICGSCECRLEEGEVELLENEYLTEKEEHSGHILACMSIPLSRKIKLNFDLI